jgi:hypothetical protein
MNCEAAASLSTISHATFVGLGSSLSLNPQSAKSLRL